MSGAWRVGSGEGPAFWVVGDTYTIKADAAATGGGFGLVEASVPPGGGPPPHSHGREDESYWVLEGELLFRTPDRKLRAGPGDFVFLPRGIEHSFTNPGAEPARTLLLVTPGGFEGFFAEVGVPARPGGRAPALDPADLPRLVAATERFGGRVALPGGVGHD
jgi:mannose-6-phosphate isomerase-like protein (cupin superfamily)